LAFGPDKRAGYPVRLKSNQASWAAVQEEIVGPPAPVCDVAVIPEEEMVDALVHYAERIMAEGAAAVLAGADLEGARRAAEEDRAALLDEKGADANASEQSVELIRRHLGETSS